MKRTAFRAQPHARSQGRSSLPFCTDSSCAGLGYTASRGVGPRLVAYQRACATPSATARVGAWLPPGFASLRWCREASRVGFKIHVKSARTSVRADDVRVVPSQSLDCLRSPNDRFKELYGRGRRSRAAACPSLWSDAAELSLFFRRAVAGEELSGQGTEQNDVSCFTLPCDWPHYGRTAFGPQQNCRTEGVTMHPNEYFGVLERAISQLRETLAAQDNPVRTPPIEYLDELQAAVEAVGRAIKDERWVRAGAVEFQGE